MKGDKAEKKAAKAEKKAAKQEAAAKKKAAKKAANAKKKAAKMEKKAKNRIAKQEEKAEKLAQEADQEPRKGGGKKKLSLLVPIILALLAVLAYFVIIPRFFSKEKEPEPEPEPEPITAPVTYQMGQTAVPALPAWGANVLVYLEDPPEPPEPEPAEDGPEAPKEDGETEEQESEKDDGSAPETQQDEGSSGEENAEEGEEAQEEPAEPPVITAVRYRYEGYADQKELLMAYAAFMTAPDVGFSFVDESLVRLKEGQHPIMTTHRGIVTLARNAVDEADAGKAMTIQLEWTDTNCFVTVDTPEGRVTDPPPPPTANASTAMTLMEAMDFVNSLDPADLGLPGSSMEDYTIYAMDGAVMIDNIPCMHINVYDNHASGTNVVAGQYFMSADGQHIYLLHPDSNTVEELDALP